MRKSTVGMEKNIQILDRKLIARKKNDDDS